MNKWGINIGITKDASPEQVRAEWVKWLRSGRLPQGKRKLCSIEVVEGNYGGQSYQASLCCLGVLCEIAAEVGIVTATLHDQGSYDYPAEPHVAYADASGALGTSVLTDTVASWAGITNAGDMYESVHNCNAVTGLNDTQEWDFPRIADLIEQGKLTRD